MVWTINRGNDEHFRVGVYELHFFIIIWHYCIHLWCLLMISASSAELLALRILIAWLLNFTQCACTPQTTAKSLCVHIHTVRGDRTKTPEAGFATTLNGWCFSKTLISRHNERLRVGTCGSLSIDMEMCNCGNRPHARAHLAGEWRGRGVQRGVCSFLPRMSDVWSSHAAH